MLEDDQALASKQYQPVVWRRGATRCFRVDIVDWHRASPEFKRVIEGGRELLDPTLSEQ
jgi:hypothetical protein